MLSRSLIRFPCTSCPHALTPHSHANPSSLRVTQDAPFSIIHRSLCLFPSARTRSTLNAVGRGSYRISWGLDLRDLLFTALGLFSAPSLRTSNTGRMHICAPSSCCGYPSFKDSHYSSERHSLRYRCRTRGSIPVCSTHSAQFHLELTRTIEPSARF